MGRPLRLALAIVCAVSLMAGEGRGARAQGVTEAQLQAAFLVNFTHFVEWPSADPIRMCIAANPAVFTAVGDVLKGRPPGGRAIELAALSRGETPDRCQLLYVGFERASDRADLLAQARGAVLTIGEAPQFLREGGMIRLFVEGNKMRFHIEQDTATAAGLKISAQLLQLDARRSSGSLR